jgi:hypothetical protein
MPHLAPKNSRARRVLHIAGWTCLGVGAAIVGLVLLSRPEPKACACTPPPSADRAFPDLSHFVEVGVNSPVIGSGRTGSVARFTTPDGLHCDADPSSLSCVSEGVGRMPGFPATARHLTLSPCGSEIESVGSSETGSEFFYTRDCEGYGTAPVLHPGQKVTIVDRTDCMMGDLRIPNCTPGVHGTATCAVGTNGLTACTNGKHGFVIRPSGSWTF